MTGRVIVITSGKGGVGKTTTSANIGTALAKEGHKVVLIDTDLGLRNLDLLLGLENRIVYTIVDVNEERCKLKQALVKDKKNPNLQLLAAAQTRDKSAVTAEQLKDICDKLKEKNDFVLVDCPAGIEQGFQNAVAGASEAIVVTTIASLAPATAFWKPCSIPAGQSTKTKSFVSFNWSQMLFNCSALTADLSLV